MTSIEELKNKNKELENRIFEYYTANHFKVSFAEYLNVIKPLEVQIQENEREIKKIMNDSVKVGDGITIDLYSDSHAYTIIKRTAKTITIQRDKATLSVDFVPVRIPGGFAGHCINQDEQKWTYERNPDGEIKVLHWSDKYCGWNTGYGYAARIGRNEFYDYNF